jgi:5'-nucleotidase
MIETVTDLPIAQYVGDITLYFDDKGIVQHWEGEPIFMGPDVIPDAEVLREIQPWKQIVDVSGKRVVGSLKITASGSGCYQKEVRNCVCVSIFNEPS